MTVEVVEKQSGFNDVIDEFYVLDRKFTVLTCKKCTGNKEYTYSVMYEWRGHRLKGEIHANSIEEMRSSIEEHINKHNIVPIYL